ncbi:MAG: FKBP-type peptidylprolyl isomerase [Actinomycetales bacterium]|nr:MAG: FKBP-type peptidylprolyl isomerase [Actinomycetales bacterium]
MLASVVVALALTTTVGCSDSSLNSSQSSTTSTTSTATSTATGQPSTSAAATPTVNGSVTPGPFGSPEDLALLDTIQITGEDQPQGPTVTLTEKPLEVSGTTRKVLRPGQGVVSNSGSYVYAHIVIVNGTTGAVLENTYEKKATAVSLDAEGELSGMRSGLIGVQAGSRVLVAAPPRDSFGAAGNPELGIGGQDHLVFYLDVLEVPLAQAEGTDVAPVSGLPTVTEFDPATGPSIQMPATAPPTELVSQTLIEGAGPAVTAGQTVTVHYVGALWKDGSVFDASWTRNEPYRVENIGKAQVISGWNKGLVDKTVGSRVLLVVPPAEGYGEDGRPPAISGTDTLVFVVDILDAH